MELAILRALDAVVQNLGPIEMVLHCPACGVQHVDAPEPARGWTNPPHRSHLCHGCGTVWRPADVATVGVRAVLTSGQGDTWTPARAAAAHVAHRYLNDATFHHLVDTLAHALRAGVYTAEDVRAAAELAPAVARR